MNSSFIIIFMSIIIFRAQIFSSIFYFIFSTILVIIYPKLNPIIKKIYILYISCYSLSKKADAQMILDERFNTSYITLYQFRVWLFLYLPVFQNISCYPLSNILYNQRWLFVVSIHPILLFINKDNPLNHQNQQFQHIPCYSLSQYRQVFYSVGTVSVHLMLLFIVMQWSISFSYEWFQYISCYSLSWDICNRKSDPFVSIHLMLLFIAHPWIIFVSES